MVDLGGEHNLGRLEGVVRGEVDGEEEETALVRAVRRPHDGGLSAEHVLARGPGRQLRGRVPGQVLQLLVDALQCHALCAQLLLLLLADI